MTSLSVTNSFRSLEEQGRELFHPLSLKHEDYYCFSKNRTTMQILLQSYLVLFSIMKMVYCGFNAVFFEKCQGHKMKKKMLQKKRLYNIADSLFLCCFFKEVGWQQRSWNEKQNGKMRWENESSEGSCSSSSITIHFSLRRVSHLLHSACS